MVVRGKEILLRTLEWTLEGLGALDEELTVQQYDLCDEQASTVWK